MGHFLFVVLHFAAVLFAPMGLLLTIPLHIIFALMDNRATEQRRAAAVVAREAAQQIPCPDCREPVRWDARKCKHCGSELTPLNAPPQVGPTRNRELDLAIAIGLLVGVIVLVKACG